MGYDVSDDSYDSDMDEGGGPFFYREDPFMTDLLRPRDSSEGYGKNKEDVNNESDSPKNSEGDDKDWEDYDNDDSESNEDYPLQQTTFSKLRFSCPWDPPEIYCAHGFQKLDEQRKSECTSLLSHARVYVLADKYDIPRLKNIAVQKLQKTLSQLMPIEEEFYDYISNLINFVYENTPPLSTTKEPLRQLVAHYVSYPELRMFVKSKRCVRLMRECEPFAVDLCEVLMKRRDKFWSPPE